MGLTGVTTLSAAIVGDRLGLSLASVGPLGVRVVRSEEVPAPGSSEGLAAAASRFLGGERAGEVMLVAPAAWCSTRQMAVTPAEWDRAREGVLESLEDLLPMSADEAVVGVLGLHDEREECVRGALTAAPRATVEPMLRALREASGARRERVISSSMAALGLGLESRARASVVEHDGAAETSLELSAGLPTSVDEPAPRSEAVRRIGTDVTAEALAQAAPRALIVAGEAIAPMVGVRANGWSRRAAPGAAVVAAALLIAAAPMLWGARLEAGAEAAAARRVALASEVERAESARARAEERRALARAFDDATGDWASSLPALRDAIGALGERGFLYRLQIEGDAMTMTGEAADVGAVLERLEASPTLSNVGTTAPLTGSPTDPALSVFTIRAEVTR